MAEGETGQDPIGGAERAGDARLARLDAQLRAAASAEKIRTGTARQGSDRGYRQGSRVLTELIAGPAGGALVGWLVDRWLGTSPWVLLVLLFLGFAVAIRNIVRISGQPPE